MRAKVLTELHLKSIAVINVTVMHRLKLHAVDVDSSQGFCTGPGICTFPMPMQKCSQSPILKLEASYGLRIVYWY